MPRGESDRFAEFESIFPGLDAVLCGEADPSLYEYRAVSIFDSWLGPERLGELDCDSDEFSKRCGLLDRFNSALLDQVTAMRIGFVGDDSALSIAVHDFRSIDDARSHVRQTATETSAEEFFNVLLPEWQAIYLESWDFTNVFFLRDSERIADIQQLAASTGLHVLEKNW
jgi:hypothetical protein